MDPNRKIPKKFTKKFDSKVISRQFFHRKTGLKSCRELSLLLQFITCTFGPAKICNYKKMLENYFIFDSNFNVN